MDVQNCPKCGSNQVVNDQCLKCGIVVSKFLKSSQPVSFVASSPHSYKEHSYSISKETLEYEERRKKNKRQTLLIGVGIVVGLALIGFIIWSLLARQAAAYSGVYKNGNLIYGMFFPESESKWYHAQASNLESLGMKNPDDAFYRGENRSEPDLSIVLFKRTIQPVPEKMNDQQKEELLAEEEALLIRRMKLSRVSCQIVDSVSRNVGGRDGFLIEAEIDKNGNLYRAFVMTGYYYGSAYTLFFVGPDHIMEKSQAEIERLMDSFTFKTSVI